MDPTVKIYIIAASILTGMFMLGSFGLYLIVKIRTRKLPPLKEKD